MFKLFRAKLLFPASPLAAAAAAGLWTRLRKAFV